MVHNYLLFHNILRYFILSLFIQIYFTNFIFKVELIQKTVSNEINRRLAL